jgi:two-component system, NtrC family, response regulator AtoC
MERRVLVVDDDPEVRQLIEAALRDVGFEISLAGSGEEALALIAVDDYDVVVTDLQMPGMNGLEVCERIAQIRPDVPVVILTGQGTLDAAVGAIRVGAYDFVTHPLALQPFQLVIERAARHRELTVEVKRLREMAAPQPFAGLVGSSQAMRIVFDMVARVASTDSTVLITGETGSGKELIARAVHQRSRRAAGPFVAINCAAMPEALLESELFGHAKGAFTDAKVARPGLLLQASGGTLLLDEIGEMPPAAQAKLLRVLQERTVRPVGGDRELPLDLRIVAATNRDLERAVEEGRFREDLFYRIHVVRIEVPPLKARGADVLELAQHALERFAGLAGKQVTSLSSAAAERLLSYDWPGNVRELNNAIERAVALSRYEELTVEDLPQHVRELRGSQILVADDAAHLPPMEEVERRYVLRVLDAVHGNKALAARVLGFDRKTLYRKMERFGVAPPLPVDK